MQQQPQQKPQHSLSARKRNPSHNRSNLFQARVGIPAAAVTTAATAEFHSAWGRNPGCSGNCNILFQPRAGIQTAGARIPAATANTAFSFSPGQESQSQQQPQQEPQHSRSASERNPSHTRSNLFQARAGIPAAAVTKAATAAFPFSLGQESRPQRQP